MKKPIFTENEIYHVYNRGVEKRNIFMDNDDYFHFIHYLFYLNDKEAAKNLNRQISKMSEIQSNSFKKPRKLLVEILAFVLMPNHFHLILRQKEKDGVIKFMQKVGIGYTMSFNKKNKRVGHLFQGRFKAVLIEKDAHFMYLPHYIHLNPLSLLTEKKSSTLIDKMNFLERYRWSSLPDYIGIKNFPSVIQKDLLLNFFGGEEKYKKDIEGFIKNNEKNPIKEQSKIVFDIDKNELD